MFTGNMVLQQDGSAPSSPEQITFDDLCEGTYKNPTTAMSFIATSILAKGAKLAFDNAKQVSREMFSGKTTRLTPLFITAPSSRDDVKQMILDADWLFLLVT